MFFAYKRIIYCEVFASILFLNFRQFLFVVFGDFIDVSLVIT